VVQIVLERFLMTRLEENLKPLMVSPMWNYLEAVKNP